MMIAPDGDSPPSVPLTDVMATALLSDVLGAMSEAAILFTGDLRPFLANREAIRRLAIPQDTPLSSQSANAIVAPFSEVVWQLLVRAHAGEEPLSNAVLDPRSDAWLQVRVVRGGTGLLLLISEQSERQQLSRTLSREEQHGAALESQVLSEAERIERLVSARARAMAAREESMARDRRLAAVGQLAAGVMHDVNNALNPIMAAAYLLRHHAESPDAVRDYAERIRKAAEMGAATASRVGRFIRQEPMHEGADELMDLSVIADELLELAEPMMQQRAGDAAHVRLIRDFVAHAPMRGVPGEIREALLNLVTNAMDALPRGGKLTVRTALEGDDVLVSVHDSGTGMTEDVRERAFEPFFTTKGAGGSGLGLAEVYGVVRRHRGTAAIESSPGNGTLVTLRFPVEHGLVPAPSTMPDVAKSVPVHILIVEDHTEGRDFLRRLLQAEGHIVDAVGTCAEAREKLASASVSEYTLMLTDVGLPDGSGWDLVAFAKAQRPGLRVGVITGWEPMASKAESVGAEFVLRKPLRAAELLNHIAGGHTPALPE